MEKEEAREITIARYIIEEKCTVRAAAARFGISKSTVHSDITNKLEKANAELYKEVQEIMKVNKEQRHIRGGEATKRKYAAKWANNS